MWIRIFLKEMDGSSVLESVVAAAAASEEAGERPSVREQGAQRGRCQLFSAEQKKTLMRYFDEYGMTSTHRRNTELMHKCASEIGTSVDRVKNWIGAEVVKRKRKAGILPRPRTDLTGITVQGKLGEPRTKKIKRLNGYNVFFSGYVKNNVGISTDFCERNALVAQKWAELTEEDRKQWGLKAESICSASIQELASPHQPSSLLSPQRSLPSLLSPSTLTPEMNPQESLVEKTLLVIQEKFDLLEQLGFEGYAIFINTGELQTHLLATSKGKSYHKMKQQTSKPLENPFIGYVFSEESDSAAASGLVGGLHGLAASPGKRMGGLVALNCVQLQTMQKSVMNAFALKYKVSTGRSDVPYDSLQNLGVQVYGMPPEVPFHSPLLYNQQQLQQILANLEKIVFLKLPSHITTSLHDGSVPLSEVEIATDSVAALVTSNELHIGAEEEANQ